ncbi:MAG: TIM barrel protein [Clostridiales bacterium]|jgi:hydroxypyruvate isomerase|nr:TIM barrel protein [Clostridiales bacterium]
MGASFSVCVDAVFRGKDFLESMSAIKHAGFEAYEFWSYWDKDIESIYDQQKKLNLTPVAICTKFISLTNPATRDAYIHGLKETLTVAEKLGCKMIISQVGSDTGQSRTAQHESIIAGLKQCVHCLERRDIVLAIEPLNVRVDHADYYLYSSDEAFDIVKAVNSDNVKVLYDIYHQHITEGDIINGIENNIDKIGHFHAAGYPGRHELYNGEINYPEIFQRIQGTGFSRYIGLEYFPIEEVSAGLKNALRMIK